MKPNVEKPFARKLTDINIILHFIILKSQSKAENRNSAVSFRNHKSCCVVLPAVMISEVGLQRVRQKFEQKRVTLCWLQLLIEN